MRDLDSVFSACSFLICAFRDDCDCSISKALSLLRAVVVAGLSLDWPDKEGRKDEEVETGVRFEAVKN